MNQKNIVLSIAAIAVIASMMVSTTQITKIVYADRDSKTKTWVDSIISTSNCDKPDGCKSFKELAGDPLNKLTRDQCESSGDKCKQVK